MNVWVLVLLLLLICGAFGGGFAGWYPHTAGVGLGTVLIIVLVVLLLTGRL
jgi:hypothetical protein